MRTSNFLACAAFGLTLASALTTNTAGPASAEAVAATPQLTRSTDPIGPVAPTEVRRPAGTIGPRGYPRAAISSSKWGVISRNTEGSPSAFYRGGPYGRSLPTNASATVPPPYGIGSLGIIVGYGSSIPPTRSTEKIDFGNETDFAGIPLRNINVLKYWIFAGTDNITNVSLPLISIEADPRLPTVSYTSLNYLPDTSVSPSAPAVKVANTWQQYDASAAGSKWYVSSGTLAGLIGCGIGAPCSFNELKAKLPNAVISLSLGISKGRDNAFVGAVDGLQVNNTVYDFEPFGVRRTIPRP